MNISPSVFHAVCFTFLVLPCCHASQARGSELADSLTSSVAVINDMIDQQWQARGLQPSPLASDAQFVRRLYLDLIGRIPTLEESATFLNDHSTDRRQHLIDRLLEDQESAAHLATVLDAVLLGRKGAESRKQREQHGWQAYLRESISQNRPWDQMAREMLLARNTPGSDPRAGWFIYEHKDQYQELAESIAPGFFGIRIECAQCHDHPLASEIQQQHYWGLVAFFNRSQNTSTQAGPRVAESAVGGFSKFTDLAGDSYETQLVFFGSDAVPEDRTGKDGDKPEDKDEYYVASDSEQPSQEPRIPVFSRREQFVEQVLDGHPLLAASMVNRMWALLIGRGFVHPVDRIDSMHDPSHPELFEWLAQDFRDHGYDLRRLVRQIVSSDAYQLDSRPANNRARAEDFAYGLPKPLMAESFVKSICVALQCETDELSAELEDEFLSKFPDVLPETDTSTLAQSLFLSNSESFNQLLRVDRSPLLRHVRQMSDAGDQTDYLFQVMFGRTPDDDERARVVSYLTETTDKDAGLQNTAWAMLTSAEFRINH